MLNDAAVVVVVQMLEERILFGYYSGDPVDETPYPGTPCGPSCDCLVTAPAGDPNATGPTGPNVPNRGPGGGSNPGGGFTPGAVAMSPFPVRDFDGTPVFSSNDLSSSGFGKNWGQDRSWTGLNNGSLNGNG